MAPIQVSDNKVLKQTASGSLVEISLKKKKNTCICFLFLPKKLALIQLLKITVLSSQCSMYQETKCGLAGSSVQGLIRLKQRCQTELQSCQSCGLLFQAHWLLVEFSSLWMYDCNLSPQRQPQVICHVTLSLIWQFAFARPARQSDYFCL